MPGLCLPDLCAPLLHPPTRQSRSACRRTAVLAGETDGHSRRVAARCRAPASRCPPTARSRRGPAPVRASGPSEATLPVGRARAAGRGRRELPRADEADPRRGAEGGSRSASLRIAATGTGVHGFHELLLGRRAGIVKAGPSCYARHRPACRVLRPEIWGAQWWPVPADGSRGAVGGVTGSPTGCAAVGHSGRRTWASGLLRPSMDRLRRVTSSSSARKPMPAGVDIERWCGYGFSRSRDRARPGRDELPASSTRSCSWQDGAVVEFRSQSGCRTVTGLTAGPGGPQ